MSVSKISRGLVVAIAAAGFAVAPAPDASAQFGLKIGRGGVKGNIPGGAKKLREAKDFIRQGQKARPSKYTLPKADVAAAIEKCEALLAQADAKLKGLSVQNGYKDAKSKRDQLAGNIKQDKLLAVCGGHWLDIKEFHTQGKLAPDSALDALDQSVAVFVKQAPKGFENAVRWWSKEAKRLRTDNPIVAKKAKEEADRQAARAAQQADRAKKQERAKAFRGLNAVISEIDKHTKSFAGPIPAEKLTSFDTQLDHVKKVHAPAEYYFQQLKREYALYDALAGDIAGAAKILEGTTVVSGDSGGKKKLKVAFKADAGNCYLVLTSWNRWTNAEKMQNKDLAVKGGTGGAAQFFWMEGFYGGWMNAEGFCANKKLAASYTSDLVFAGSRTAVKYAVVSWPKTKLPIFVASRIGVRRYDNCDHKEWEAMWKTPIPGTVAWKGNEPYLVQYPMSFNNSGNFWGINYSSSNISNPALAKPKVPGSKKTFVMPSCKSGKQRLKSTQSYMKCLKKMDKKYDAIWTRLKKQKKYARRIGAYRAAQRGLDNLGSKRSKEYDATCGKKLKKIRAAWETTFNGLVDWVADGGPDDPTNVAAEWNKWKEASTR